MTKKKLDQIAKLLGEVPEGSVKDLLRKSEVVRVRCSTLDKAAIAAAAGRRGVTVSAYLLQLHHEAEVRT